MENKTVFEVCCETIEAVREAILGGASRVELCQALPLDGLTPSAGAIRQAVSLRDEPGRISGPIKIMVLIRPRQGDFIYSELEKEIMMNDISEAARLGADGVVIGALCDDLTIDRVWIAEAAVHARKLGLSVTFHRAFDVVINPMEALAFLIETKIDRILTSGQAFSALEGTGMLHNLIQHSAGRISIMPGAGISSKNIAEIRKLTGAHEFHGSARLRTPAGELATDRREVAEIVRKLQQSKTA